MPTVGNTSKPASSQEWHGLNVINQMGQAVTMPAGGPWLITQVGLWLAGQSMTASVRACVWDASGNLLTYSDAFTAGSLGFALGNSINYVANVPAVQVAGGASVYVGWWRDPAHSVQNGRYASGAHLHKYGAGSIVSLAGSSTDSAGGIGAYVANYQSANQAPNAPTITTAAQQHTGRTLNYSWVHSDPDGNPQADAHFQLWSEGAGWLVQEYYLSAIGAPASQILQATLPAGYAAQTTYWHRVRTSDGAAWGPWSGFAAVRSNHPPNPAYVNSPPLNTLTPVITSGGTDPDGDGLTSVQLEVLRAIDGSPRWVSPSSGGQFAGITYAGTALEWGVTYAVRARTIDDEGAWGPWGSWTYWTPAQPTGPTVTPSNVSTKQNTVTPTFTIQHTSAFDMNEIAVGTWPGGANVWTPGQVANTSGTSVNRTVPAATLAWGQTYGVWARVRVGGVWTAWSQYSPFYINAQPTAPSISVETTDAQPVIATPNSAGVLVTTDSTPRIRAPFADPDRVTYQDAPGARSFEVRRKDTQAAHQSTTSGTTEDWTLTTPLLADVVYQVRAGYRDNAGQPAGTYAYSGWVDLKYSQLPSAAATAPGATVTESTPTLDWTFTSPGGKAQLAYRVTVYDKGPTGANFANEVLVYDSGRIISTATALDVPYGVLVNGHDYRWSVTVEDTDGLAYTLV